MSLLDRISGKDSGLNRKICVLQFCAGMREVNRGRQTVDALKAAFGIASGDDLTEFNWLKGKYDASADKSAFIVELLDILLCAENSAKPDASASPNPNDNGVFGYADKTTVQARINLIA